MRINALVAKAQKKPEEGWTMQDGRPWPGNDSNDHTGMIQVNVAYSYIFLYKISINRLVWLLPYVKLSDQRKMKLLKYIERDPPISMSFRTWELYEFPLLPTNSNHIWTIKTST